MRVYTGKTYGGWMLEEMQRLGFGEMTCCGELPPKRTPWAFDSGVFRKGKRGVFSPERYKQDLDRIAAMSCQPDFVVAPDIVAGGVKSLHESVNWLPQLVGLQAYLAVQDGMTQVEVGAALDGFVGVFVGGSRDWKLATGQAWVEFAHERGRPCHIGRAGGLKSTRWALRIGADSLDSCLPLFSRANLRRFLIALEGRQTEMW